MSYTIEVKFLKFKHEICGFSINFQVTIDFPAFWLVKIHCLWSDSHWPVTIAFCLLAFCVDYYL